MKVDILEFVSGAREAKGVAVIIDVFRAFSVACYVLDAGASKLIATSGVDHAFQLKTEYRNSVLIGERDEKKIEGFDFGNSPTEIIKTDLRDKIAIHTTTAGTNGLVNAVSADRVLTGSFLNAHDKEISDLQNTSGSRFFIPGNIDFSPPTDFFLCTMLNKFDFVLKANRRFDGNIDLRKIDV